MCKALGYLVARLIRVRIDKIRLEDLKAGEYREFKIEK
jgi:16S rRNA U516 pseudouridylate synthase RsuA-like enzyme